MSVPNTVFISYAWESDEFRQRVKALRDYLVASGFPVVTDFDHADRAPANGWQAWMQHQIEDARVVLIVCSPLYKARFEKRAPPSSGKGVAWESMVITQDLYDAALFNTKFYPIFPEPLQFDDCPKALRGHSNGHSFPFKQAGIVALLRACFGLPPVHAPTASAADNPYQPWKPAVVPYFFGREEILRWLHRALDEKRSVSLVGDRRIGKSSLLLAWQAKAESLGRQVVLLSGEGPEAVSCAAFVGAIIKQSVSSNQADAAADALDAYLQRTSALPPLLLIDEAEAVLRKLPHDFFVRLRGLIGQQRLCIVLASHKPLEEVYEGTGQTSPFLNVLQMKYLALFEQTASEQMLALGGAMVGDEQKSLMRDWAGRHPFFLALCGWYMVEAASKNQSQTEMLDELNFEVKQHLHNIWQCLSAKERNALQEVACEGKGATSSLRLRGLVLAEGRHERLFGLALTLWLEEQV